MNELLKNLVCSGNECFCWILVLINIFAVFYLVFCSFWKISGLVKLSGWVYSGVLIGATVLVLFFHACIYTLMAAVFTGMILMAILSIILPQQQDSYENREKVNSLNKKGAYVISQTDDGWFAFELYVGKKKLLASSTYAYRSIEEAKEAIASCRENGKIAETEDRSGPWIQEKYIPKFELYKCENTYGFSLRVFEEDSIIHSKTFSMLASCLNFLEATKAHIDTTEIYMSLEKIGGDNYKKWGVGPEESIEEEPVSENITEEVPVIEEAAKEPPVKEEPVAQKKCIVGVVWPESSNPDRTYRYQVPKESVKVGDTVTAPTYDSYNKKDVVRQARVISVEYYGEGENMVLPSKSIISVDKD